MTKQGDSGEPGEGRSAKGRRKTLYVVGKDGLRHRFLRGMITSDLVKQGLDFRDAYAVARAVRDRLSDRSEVASTDVKTLVDEELRRAVDQETVSRLGVEGRPAPSLYVVTKGQRAPFSLGLLARSVCAAGLELDRAYGFAAQIESDLRSEGVEQLSSYRIADRMATLLERSEGAAVARRYRLVRRIRQLPRPLIVYIGGASGTGKSTLAMEVAPLLRIFRVIATDTIRQIMRTVFTPAILPALHASSFEAEPENEPLDKPLGAARDPEYHRRLISSFEEQSTRVCVGIRAVVERAIAENMSIIVEGVHVHPGLVPFHDLDGDAYQVALTLATPNEEVHRPRFLMRSQRSGRTADRYLESFSSIRIIHDYLLQQAEAHDMPLMDNSEEDPPVDRMMRLVTGIIGRRVPHLAEDPAAELRVRVPTLLLCIDGLADQPVRALGSRTPLQAASIPTFDRLCREGRSGLADPVGPGVVPDTASGSLAVLGQSPLGLKRGPVEALGAGIDLGPDDIAIRGNFATVDEKGDIIDRRAGRIREGARELAEALDGLPLPGLPDGTVTVRVRSSTEHRIAIVLGGPGLSSEIRGSDPGEGTGTVPPLTPSPADPDNANAAETARILSTFEREARTVLSRHPVNLDREERGLPPANAVLTRGAGRVHQLVPLEVAGESLRLACVSGDRTIRGISLLLGAEPISGDGMTANLDTDLDAKFAAAADALGRCDLVVLHVKGADIASHDRRPDLKVAFLERLDASLAKLLDEHSGSLRIAVASDHATLSESGQHAADPVPVLVWGTGIDADDVGAFDELSVAAGALERFPLRSLLSRMFALE